MKPTKRNRIRYSGNGSGTAKGLLPDLYPDEFGGNLPLHASPLPMVIAAVTRQKFTVMVALAVTMVMAGAGVFSAVISMICNLLPDKVEDA